MLIFGEDSTGADGLVMLVRRRGQRWHSLVCFGRKSHYFEDGGCEHTDAVMERMTDYGKKVTKLEGFGGGKRVPKRPRKRKELVKKCQQRE